MRRRIGLGVLAGLVLIGLFLLWRGARAPEADRAESRIAAAAKVPGTRNPNFAPVGQGPSALVAPRARISGRVTDGAGKAIGGAAVCASGGGPDLSDAELREPTCTVARADGGYLLANLYPAFWDVNASAAGHRPGRFREAKRETIQLGPGQARTGVDLVLRPGGVEVRGRVKDLGGGVVAGALVMVGPESAWSWDMPGAAVHADDKGEWRAWVAPGRVRARAQAIGYASGDKEGMAPGSFIEILLTPESVLVGRVVESGSGAPVAGAVVSSHDDSMAYEGGGSALSDAEGRFRIERLKPGRYKPVAQTVDRHGQARESVVLGLGQRSAEVLVVVHPAVTLIGKVLIAGEEKPCREGWAGLNDPQAQRRMWSSIRSDGSVEVRALLPGRYQVSVNCTDHLPEERYPPVVVSDRPLPAMTWHVRQGLHIAGTLVMPDGTGVEEGAIGATLAGGDPRAQRADGWETVRPDGSFRLNGLLPGTYRLQIVAPGQPEPREPPTVTLAPGRSVEGLRIVLDRAGAVKGTVADQDGRPVGGAEVRANGDAWGWIDVVLTQDDGSFRIEGLRPGSYRVIASRSAWGDEMRAPGGGDDDLHGVKVSIKAGSVVPVKLTVERQSGQITGTVSQNGKPVSDAFVDAQRESESAAAAEGSARRTMRWEWDRQPVLTDADGRFTVSRLSPGKYLVRAYRRGGGEAVAEHVPVGTPVALVIKPTGALSGTLAITGQAPPEQFRIGLVDDDAGISVTESFLRTGGQWTLRELPAGQFKLRAEAREGSAEESVTLAEGQSRTGIRLEVKPRASLRGQVVALDSGKPVPGMRVMAQLPSSSGQFYFEEDSDGEKKNITDAEGRYELKDTPPGRLLVYVSPLDREGSEFEFCAGRATLQAGQQLELPPIRCPRRRLKGPREVGGDLGYTLKEMNPTAAVDPIPLVVAVVRPGGPASAAGLRVGDVLTSVDGQDVTGMNDYLFWTLTRVPEGTTVTFGLARGQKLAITAGPQP